MDGRGGGAHAGWEFAIAPEFDGEIGATASFQDGSGYGMGVVTELLLLLLLVHGLIMLIEGPVLFFPAFVPAEDFTELAHEIAVGEEISALSDEGGCVDVVLGEEVDGFEEFVVGLAIVKRSFDALEEMGLVSGGCGWWSGGWGRDVVSR